MCVCVSLNLKWLSDSGSQWNCSKSWRTFCMPYHVCVCKHVSVFKCERVYVCAQAHVHMCVYVCEFKRVPCRGAARQTFLSAVSLGCLFSTSGLRVSMCNNDYLHLNHKEQENPDNCNTQRETPTCLDPDEIWQHDLLSSAQPQLKAGTHNNLWELRPSLC